MKSLAKFLLVIGIVGVIFFTICAFKKNNEASESLSEAYAYTDVMGFDGNSYYLASGSDRAKKARNIFIVLDVISAGCVIAGIAFKDKANSEEPKD